MNFVNIIAHKTDVFFTIDIFIRTSSTGLSIKMLIMLHVLIGGGTHYIPPLYD